MREPIRSPIPPALSTIGVLGFRSEFSVRRFVARLAEATSALGIPVPGLALGSYVSWRVMRGDTLREDELRCPALGDAGKLFDAVESPHHLAVHYVAPRSTLTLLGEVSDVVELCGRAPAYLHLSGVSPSGKTMETLGLALYKTWLALHVTCNDVLEQAPAAVVKRVAQYTDMVGSSGRSLAMDEVLLHVSPAGPDTLLGPENLNRPLDVEMVETLLRALMKEIDVLYTRVGVTGRLTAETVPQFENALRLCPGLRMVADFSVQRHGDSFPVEEAVQFVLAAQKVQQAARTPAP